MNKIVVVGILVLVVAIGALFVLTQSKTENTESTNTVAESSGTSAESANSRYIAYSKDVLSNTQDSRRVLYFYANWCPTCLPANEDFNAKADQIPEDVTVIRVNYNDSDTDSDEKGLAEKYGITYQHTFVQIDSEGNEIAKWNGGQIKELLENIK